MHVIYNVYIYVLRIGIFKFLHIETYFILTHKLTHIHTYISVIIYKHMN